jgi:putative transposase
MMHALVDTGLDADGHRQVPVMQVTSSEDGAGWLAFFRDPVRRGLAAVPQRRITPDTPRQRT